MKKYKLITIIFTALLLAVSCSPKIHGLGSQGRVIRADEGRLLIIFPEVIGNGTAQGQWFRYDNAVPGDTTGYSVNMIISKNNPK